MRTLVGLLLALVLAVPAAAQTGRVSAGNSTTAVLGSGATFTGAWDDATQAAVVVVTIKADQASATNGVKVEFSSDCVNQDYVTTHTFSDTVNGQTFADAMAAKCVRVEFVNGASGQGSFRLQTVVRDNGYGGTSAGGGTASSVTINDPTITTQKLAINASGQASMTCANCSGTGASAVDRATFTLGTNSIAPSGGIFDDTPPTDLTAGMAGIVRMTPKRGFHINLRNQAGTEVGTAATPLQVTGANGTFPVTGTFFQATQPVSIAAAVDVSDRAGRLVGVVYGSQAQQLKQTATNFNLQSELAVGGTLIDPRDVSDRSGRALGSIANLFVLDATFTGRLPAGASPASAETNTNTNLSRIGTYPFVFNGTTWDRWTGAVSGTVTANAGSGNFTVAQATGTNLHIVCDSGCSSSTAPADEATFTFGTTPHSPVGGVFQTTATSNALTTGQMGAFQVTAQRALFSNLRNASGTEVGTSATPLQVTGANGTFPVTGTFFQATQPVSIADGSDTTLGAKADAKSTATDTTAVSIMSVLKEISALEQAPASRAVTNAGTFADQATLQTQTDTVMVGGVNVKEINGVAPLMGAGATGTGALRVNDVASSATGAAPPASANYVAGLCSGATGGFLCGPTVGDTPKVINISTATTTLMITGVSGRQVHITSFHMITAGANNVAWLEGTGATCGTGTAGMAGGTTAASGYNFAANGGIALGTGIGDVLRTATTGDSVCLITSGTTQLSGFIEYAIY